MDIKIKNKYIFFKYNLNKVNKVCDSNTKDELKNKMKGKKIEGDILLMKFQKKRDWSPTTKIPVSMLGGPIKVLFEFYEISDKGVLKKKEDERSVQFIYYTYDYYLEHKINSEDLLKLAKLVFENKLEKRLMAPKLITQINKIK
jgi:hypothetical protein